MYSPFKMLLSVYWFGVKGTLSSMAHAECQKYMFPAELMLQGDTTFKSSIATSDG